MGREKLPEIPANASKSWHEVVERPNDLAKKVPRTGGIEPERHLRPQKPSSNK